MDGWRKSRRCDSAACVEVWPDCRTVWVRDATGTVLVVDRDGWRSLVAGIKMGALP